MESPKITKWSTKGIWDIQTKTKNRLWFVFPFHHYGLTGTLCIANNEVKNITKGLNLVLKKKLGSQYYCQGQNEN